MASLPQSGFVSSRTLNRGAVLFNFPQASNGDARKMGTSMVRYGDHGFWARDTLLEVWLQLLVRELDEEPDREDWLTEVRDEWEHQATAGYNGYIEVKLFIFAYPDDRRRKLLDVSQATFNKLMARDDDISVEELNAMNTGGSDHTFWTPLSAEQVAIVARPFNNLLSGQVEADESIFEPR